MSADIPFEDHNHAIQELQTKLVEAHDVHDRHIAQLAKQHDAEITTRRVSEAIATTSALKVIPSPLRPQKIRPVSTPLQSSSSMAAGTSSSSASTTPVPLMAARTSFVCATTPQSALDEALRARGIQEQPQEVDWNKRPPIKATLASVTRLLKDFDVYKRETGS